MALPRPFAKGNLSHQFRLDPMDVSADTGGLGKRIRGQLRLYPASLSARAVSYR